MAVYGFLLVLLECAMLTLPIQQPDPVAGQRAAAGGDEIARGFLYKTISIGDQAYAYCVYVPPDYDPAAAWPLILFLHGSGERGADGFLQTEVGLPNAIRRYGLRPAALIVMPQCRAGMSWSGEMAQIALRCVEKTAHEYRVDPQRLYLTGLSLGGAGTWLIGAALAERFAALVPVCGFGNPADGERLARVPTWVFHGATDEAVPVERSREMVDAIGKAGGEVKYTEYPGVGHNCWDKAYRDPELYTWLFAQRRSPARPSGATSRPAASRP